MDAEGLRAAGFDLGDDAVLVTGAAGGLGAATARGLARAGARLVLADLVLDGVRELAEEIAAAGGRALALPLDVTDPVAVASVVERTLREYGRLDTLVNCAGITLRKAAVEFTVAEFDRIIAVNLKGTWLCCQAAGRAMIERRKGRIINMSSIGGQVGLPMSVAYCASKGGVVQITRTLAVEWAPFGITVNAIAPCTFETAMVGAVLAAEPEYRERVVGRIPLGRMGKPEEIVGTVLYLASPAAAMVTGHILAVDGGYMAQ